MNVKIIDRNNVLYNSIKYNLSGASHELEYPSFKHGRKKSFKDTC